MDKEVELTKTQKNEDKLLIAKVLDKIKIVDNKNRFENTNFLDLMQKSIIEDILIKRKEENYIFFGGYDQAERKILILYPSFMNYKDIANNLMSVIRINLPKEMYGKYEHKTYLGALIKLGIRREKIGDILVRNDGADIVILKEIEKFLVNNLPTLTRFQKSEIKVINIDDIKFIEKEKKYIKINVPSMRLDAIVGELAKVSRTIAEEYINGERVFVNFRQEIKSSKQIEEGSIITIRGKGRFTISKVLGKTRSDRINLEILKW